MWRGVGDGVYAHAAAWCASRNGWRSSRDVSIDPVASTHGTVPRHSPRHPARRCQLHAIRWTEPERTQQGDGDAARRGVCGMVARRSTWPVGHAPGASPATENGFRSSLSYPRACSSSATRQGSTRGKAGGAERSGARAGRGGRTFGDSGGALVRAGDLVAVIQRRA